MTFDSYNKSLENYPELIGRLDGEYCKGQTIREDRTESHGSEKRKSGCTQNIRHIFYDIRSPGYQ